MKKVSTLVFIFLIIIPVLAALLFSILRSRNIFKARAVNSEIDTVVLSSADGKPAFATGNCNQNSDCFTTGCSSQVCANHEVFTTCEVTEIPEKKSFSCGCIESRCVWYKKN